MKAQEAEYNFPGGAFNEAPLFIFHKFRCAVLKNTRNTIMIFGNNKQNFL